MTQISYVLIVPTTEQILDVTPFQGFNLAVVDPEFIAAVRILCLLPNSTDEIFMNQAALLARRLEGSHKTVHATGQQVVTKHEFDYLPGLIVVVAIKALLEKAKEITKDLQRPFLILTTTNDPAAVNIAHFGNLHPGMIDEVIFEKMKMALPDIETWPSLREAYDSDLGIPSRGAGVTIAAEISAVSLGFTFSNSRPINPDTEENYFEAIGEILDHLDKRAFGGVGISELVVYAPAIAAQFYDTKSKFWNDLLRDTPISWHRKFVKESLIRNRGYSRGEIRPNDELKSPYEDPVVGPILALRQRELYATHVAVALLSSCDAAIPLRLPNSVNLHWPLLKEIEALHRRKYTKKNEIMLQDRFRHYSDQLQQAASHFLDHIRKASSIKICSDAPLEWMFIDDLPLMISHEVARLPMTTGNMLLQYSALGPKLVVPSADLHHILVIRSFNEDDAIRRFLEMGIEQFKVRDKLNVQIVDAKTIEDVIVALNGYAGAIVIFDCHGQHSGIDGSGWLTIGEEKLNTWELAQIARVPPIVLLSACSTSAIAGSHASVANGFLRSGAASVIGTFLEINAAKSSAFVARILYRIHSFLPILTKMGVEKVTWRTLISTFLRMSYVTDLLYYCKEERLIDSSAWREIGSTINQHINALNPAWYDFFLQEISSHSGVEKEQLRKKFRKSQALVETMLYCHHGRPDWIEISVSEGDATRTKHE